jgi:L,D-transpeptidase YcbB
MNVVVGKALNHQTPVFAKEMKYIIFRPYWNLPLDITRAEIVPKLLRTRTTWRGRALRPQTRMGTS